MPVDRQLAYLSDPAGATHGLEEVDAAYGNGITMITDLGYVSDGFTGSYPETTPVSAS